ncbi:MAG TPA: ArgP/LysG family DNA-binding transcriptional regulator [Marmoricola sp.]|nr:ArgP/LysG family DNA-binding transcriptional regulator [Marmoricola sp.]
MRFDPSQLETLVAIAEEGTFEAAARRLHLTPSAVSQRIRALESAAGKVLVRRTIPAGVTEAGEPLLRLGRQLQLLAAEAEVDLDDHGVINLPVAVNADSLATWFRPVLTSVADHGAIALRLFIEDQAYSHDLLRRGEVLAAVTDNPQPVQGCVAQSLGTLRYTACAARSLVERWRHGRSVDWSVMPMVVVNEKDHLQDQLLQTLGTTRPPIVHRVPSVADFFAAISCGLGWGLIPELQATPAINDEQLVSLPGAKPVNVELYWQRWRLDSPTLATLTDDVLGAARQLRRSR